MKQIITIDYYLNGLSHLSIIDVRSPGEFEKGHIPGAVNIPLFTDEERATVGTAYKQVCKEKAIELGYKFVTPKLESFISESLNVAPTKTVAVHCWRGGMRSNAFADHLVKNGFENVFVIEKGYKAYRNYIHSYFEKPFQLKILGGYTGSGKTEILQQLALKGEQMIDLEGLANHRGSAFGGIDLPPQPTTEQFENNLFTNLKKLDIAKPIWVEDESNAVGRVNIPKPFFLQMRSQNVYLLNISQNERAKHLVDTYAGLNKEGLAEAIEKITKRLGFDKGKFALQELEKGNYYKVVEIILFYYDKYYLRGIQKRDKSTIQEINLDSVNHAKNAEYLIQLKN